MLITSQPRAEHMPIGSSRLYRFDRALPVLSRRSSKPNENLARLFLLLSWGEVSSNPTWDRAPQLANSARARPAGFPKTATVPVCHGL
jgi:hypothetical protein